MEVLKETKTTADKKDLRAKELNRKVALMDYFAAAPKNHHFSFSRAS
jgi:hypothetical protein